jgi:uncharacterized membrane protein YeaQ/YmgE (transglycosylase-associated protein family)
MGLIGWLIIGLIAGAVAKMITPQDEKGGWVSSLVVGLIGSILGGFLGRLTGISYIFGSGWFSSLIIAVLGAILVLYIYHKYLKEKLNLPL